MSPPGVTTSTLIDYAGCNDRINDSLGMADW
jgi:hypothetical protein